MANIVSTASPSVYQITEWLGLNESPDGDTSIKLGESPKMRNFRITREKHLQLRPGYAAVCALAEGNPVRGLWEGYVAGEYRLMAACGGHLYRIDTATWMKTDCGAIPDSEVSFFGFAQKLYILTGSEYYAWDGATLAAVEGYAPIVTTAVPPAGGGTLLEGINLLTGKKRAQFSPDGTSTAFQLPETGIDEVTAVEGTSVTYTVNASAGKVTFSSAPPQGVNTITITWRKGTGSREKVQKMRFAELYNGESDSRVFLYGDGTNEAVYSGLDESGQPSAEYFPELNTMSVDSANTPITAMIRHYDRLLVFKYDSAYSVQYTTITTGADTVTAGFLVSSLNREIGNVPAGQVLLVDNVARTIGSHGIYDWSLANYTARDERNAKRVSDRVATTLSGFDLEGAVTFDDEKRQEYYLVSGDEALVHNYEVDAWYYYSDFPARCMALVGGDVYFGTPDGRLMHLSRQYRNSDLRDIDAWWESGSIGFEYEWRRKYSSLIWVGIKPETQGRVMVTVESNLKSDYPEKPVAAGLANFTHADFAHWSFKTNRKPQLVRNKLKVKKVTYYKLIFHSISSSATATVLSTDIQVRYTGNVK